MELQQFIEKVKNAMYQYYDTKVKIDIHQVYKNNGLLLHGICALQEGRNIAPTVYLNDFFRRYKDGESFGALMKEIIHLMEKNQVDTNLNIDFFGDYEKVKKRLVFRLIHKERNKELLKDIPYWNFHDLAVACHCLMLTEEFGTGTILIHKKHLESWNVSEKQLFEDTGKNSPQIEPYSILRMSDMVRSLMEDTVKERVDEICEEYPQDKNKLFERTMEDMVQEIEEHQVSMYILTNSRRYYGATCMIYEGVLEKIAEFLQEDFYILPSSVHEIIFLKKSEAVDTTFLNEMIRDVNQTQVAEEEWLSDHTYLYKRDTHKLVPIV